MPKLRAFIARHLPHGSFSRSVALLASGTAAGQAIAVLCTPIWTRLYSPEQTGLFAVFMACASFATAAVTLRYEIAVPGVADDSDADALLLLSILLALPCSVVLSGFLLLLISQDVISLGRLPLWSAAALVPALSVTGVFSALRYWFVRQKDFHTISKVLVVQGSIRGGLPIFLGLLRMNWTGLLLGEIAARSAGMYTMLTRALPNLRVLVHRHGLRTVVLGAKRNRTCPTFLLPAALVDLLALTLPVPLIAHYYGPSAAGVFFIAQRLTTLPVSFIGASVADVFHATIAEKLREDPTTVKPMLMSTMARLAKLGLITLGPLAALAPLLCGKLFGGRYGEAGPLVAILFPWCLAQLISSPLSRLLIVANRGGLLLLVDIVSTMAILAGFSLGHAGNLSFLQCIGLVSVLEATSYALYALFLVRVAKDCQKLSPAAVPLAVSD